MMAPRYAVLVWFHDSWSVTFAGESRSLADDVCRKARASGVRAVLVDTLDRAL